MTGVQISPEAQRLHQVLLRTVADDGAETGAFPSVSDTHAGASSEAFGELVEAGLIEHDATTGMVTAVLPLVAGPPGTLVILDPNMRLERFAASVLDAFALAPLLGRRVRIYGWCPICEEPVQVLTDPNRIRRREPRSTVAVRTPGEPRSTVIRLACSPEHAQAAITASGQPDAVFQSIEVLAIEARERYLAVLER